MLDQATVNRLPIPVMGQSQEKVILDIRCFMEVLCEWMTVERLIKQF